MCRAIPGGAIFPDLFDNSPNGEVLGPTGLGGGNPLASWSSSTPLDDLENYQIDLVGAFSAVPEPSSALLWMSATLAATYYRHRRHRSALPIE